MKLDKLPKDLREYVRELANNDSFQYYFANDPVLDDFFDQQKKFDEKIDTLIDFLRKDFYPFEKDSEIGLLKKMKEENALSIGKKIDERTSNLIVEYMVLHGKIKAEDFDNTVKLMMSDNEEERTIQSY